MHSAAYASPPFFQRGDLFLNRYRIYSLLGAGGFGQVYYAYDQTLQREVAVKVSRRASLVREGQLLASVSHPNIPLAYDFGHAREGSYLIMQYIRGNTLAALIQEAMEEDHGLPVEQVYNVALQLCSALADLHEHQPPLIFRDLKPTNILMTRTEKIYLVDFGIVCVDPRWSPLPNTLAWCGTPGYLAPEVVRNPQQVTPASDLYALGKTLYQLLVPNVCTCSSTPCIYGHAPLRPLRGPLGSLVMQLLESDLRRRPADAGELRALLQELLAIRERETFESSGRWQRWLHILSVSHRDASLNVF